MNRKLSAAVFFAAVTTLAFAVSAGAVDGTIDINQAKVIANGGFPYTITASGSYRLTGNLASPGSTNGINVNASNVTIDLNGFSITGAVIGGGGIDAQPGTVGTTVENGTVTGFGTGVQLGSNSIVKSVHADSNYNAGIYITSNNGLIEGCTANSNTQNGAILGNNGVIEGSTANSNGSNGILCTGYGCAISGNTASGNNTGISVSTGSLIVHNTIDSNTTVGISASDATTGYGENVINGNGMPVTGGTSLGEKNTNLCSGTAC